MICSVCRNKMDRLYVKVGKKLTPFAWGCVQCRVFKADGDFKLNMRKRDFGTFYWSPSRGEYCYGIKRAVYKRSGKSWLRVGYLYYPEGHIEFEGEPSWLKDLSHLNLLPKMLSLMLSDPSSRKQAKRWIKEWSSHLHPPPPESSIPLSSRDIAAVTFTCTCGKHYFVSFEKAKVQTISQHGSFQVLTEIKPKSYVIRLTCPICFGSRETKIENENPSYVCRCGSLYKFDMEDMRATLKISPERMKEKIKARDETMKFLMGVEKYIRKLLEQARDN